MRSNQQDILAGIILHCLRRTGHINYTSSALYSFYYCTFIDILSHLLRQSFCDSLSGVMS